MAPACLSLEPQAARGSEQLPAVILHSDVTVARTRVPLSLRPPGGATAPQSTRLFPASGSRVGPDGSRRLWPTLVWCLHPTFSLLCLLIHLLIHSSVTWQHRAAAMCQIHGPGQSRQV